MRKLACVAFAVAVALAGCGGGDDKPKRYSVETVMDHFQKQTGDRLTAQSGTEPGLTILRFHEPPYVDKYGDMFISIVTTDDAPERVHAIVDNRSAKTKVTEGDLHWTHDCPPRDLHIPCFWQLEEQFGENVVLTWIAGHRRTTDARFDRVHDVLADLP